ncbi:hypothetical protein C8Q78DRAFT_1058986 [Trametes maxima]|nr:hypothetical protein C8Q78DRAFT_1061127 [Trametes maxima]KAI0666696.1 hypothetical protein C8Q78DRAFT_1058986 [Trametes maxima]
MQRDLTASISRSRPISPVAKARHPLLTTVFNRSTLEDQRSPHKVELQQAPTGPTLPSPNDINNVYSPISTNMLTVDEEAVLTANTGERISSSTTLAPLGNGVASIPLCLGPPKSPTPSLSPSPPLRAGLHPHSLPPSPGGQTFSDKAVSAEATKDISIQTGTPPSAKSFMSAATVRRTTDVHAAGDEIFQTPITGPESPDIGSSAIETPEPVAGTCFPRSTVLISSTQSSVPSPTGDELPPLGVIVAPRPVRHITFGHTGHSFLEARPSISPRGLIAPELGPVSIPLPPRSPISDGDPHPPRIVRLLSPDSFIEPATPPPSLAHGDTGLTGVASQLPSADVEDGKPQTRRTLEPSNASLDDPHSSAIALSPTTSKSPPVSTVAPFRPTASSPVPTSSRVSLTVALARMNGDQRPEVRERRRGYYFSYYKETIVPEDDNSAQRGKKYIAVTVGYRVGVFYDRDHAAPYIDSCPGAQYEEHDTYLTALAMYRRARREKGVQVVEKTVG